MCIRDSPEDHPEVLQAEFAADRHDDVAAVQRFVGTGSGQHGVAAHDGDQGAAGAGPGLGVSESPPVVTAAGRDREAPRTEAGHLLG